MPLERLKWKINIPVNLQKVFGLKLCVAHSTDRLPPPLPADPMIHAGLDLVAAMRTGVVEIERGNGEELCALDAVQVGGRRHPVHGEVG